MISTLTQPYVELTDGQKEARKRFKSTDPWVNQHIQTQFGQNDKKGLAKGFVMLDESNSKIIGCYSITMHQIDFSELTKDEIKKLGTINKLPTTRPLPACLIVCFGLDERVIGKGLGTHLLIECLMRIYEISKSIGGVGVVVDVSNNEVRTFYEEFGFIKIPSPDKDTRYFLPMKELVDLFEPSNIEETN